jgi:hypothetical protein
VGPTRHGGSGDLTARAGRGVRAGGGWAARGREGAGRGWAAKRDPRGEGARGAGWAAAESRPKGGGAAELARGTPAQEGGRRRKSPFLFIFPIFPLSISL